MEKSHEKKVRILPVDSEHSAIFQCLEKNNIDKVDFGGVIAAWTQCHRKDYEEYGTWFTRRLDEDGDVVSWIERTLRHYQSFQLLCERYDLPYAHFQMNELMN